MPRKVSDGNTSIGVAIPSEYSAALALRYYPFAPETKWICSNPRRSWPGCGPSVPSQTRSPT
jgi:hypothetical protein